MEPCKNAADILLVWRCFELCREAENTNPDNNNNNDQQNSDAVVTKSVKTAVPLTFYICTKDDGYRYLATLLKQQGHRVTFVRNWADLKLYIE